MLYRCWLDSSNTPEVFETFRPSLYDEDGRSHGFLYSLPHNRPWLESQEEIGSELLDKLHDTFSIHFETVSFQAYQNQDAFCDWHYDACDEQATLSLGATRTFLTKDQANNIESITLHDGDLVFHPYGYQALYSHRLPPDTFDAGERLALVFRTGSPWG